MSRLHKRPPGGREGPPGRRKALRHRHAATHRCAPWKPSVPPSSSTADLAAVDERLPPPRPPPIPHSADPSARVTRSARAPPPAASPLPPSRYAPKIMALGEGDRKRCPPPAASPSSEAAPKPKRQRRRPARPAGRPANPSGVFIKCGRCGRPNHIRCAYCKTCFASKVDMPPGAGTEVTPSSTVADTRRPTVAPIDVPSTVCTSARAEPRPAAPTVDVGLHWGVPPMGGPWRPAGPPPPMSTAARRSPLVRALEADDSLLVTSSPVSSAALPSSPVREWHLAAAAAAPTPPLFGFEVSTVWPAAAPRAVPTRLRSSTAPPANASRKPPSGRPQGRVDTPRAPLRTDRDADPASVAAAWARRDRAANSLGPLSTRGVARDLPDVSADAQCPPAAIPEPLSLPPVPRVNSEGWLSEAVSGADEHHPAVSNVSAPSASADDDVSVPDAEAALLTGLLQMLTATADDYRVGDAVGGGEAEGAASTSWTSAGTA